MNQLTKVVILSGVVLTSFRVQAETNWTGFRGPGRQGYVEDARLPLHWSETENVKWKLPISGKAWSSPVIWEDRIWLTNAPDVGNFFEALCVDKNSGKVVVKKRLFDNVAPQYCHPFNSFASPSPVIEQGRVYVSFGSPYNACLDSKSGDVIWERSDLVCNHFRGPGSSPIIYKDLLIVHMDGSDEQYVIAMDKQTGKTVWKTDRTVDFGDLDPKTGKPKRVGDFRKAYSTPMIVNHDGKDVLISLGSMALYAYDPTTGKELWRRDAVGSHSGSCRPVVGDGLVYCPMGTSGELWAVRPDGEQVWSYKRAVPKRPSPLLVDDLLFMVDDRGIAACVDAKSGDEIWRARVGGNFSSSPIYAAGHVYFFDENGKTTIIKASREYEVVATNNLGDGFMASPAVSGNALFLRSRSHLYRIEEGGGE